MNYFADPSTEITLFCWAVDYGKINYWYLGQPIPDMLIALLTRRESFTKVAHNILFDLSAVKRFADMHGLTLAKHWSDLYSCSDTMALGDYYRYGSSLDDVSSHLGIGKKNAKGQRLMKKQTKPNRKSGEFVCLDEDEKVDFIKYGMEDVKLCQTIHKRCGPLPSREQALWKWTARQNMVGLTVDTDLLQVMDDIVEYNRRVLTHEFQQIVKGKINTINSPKLKQVFSKYYPYCDNLQAPTIKKMLADRRVVPSIVRRLLQIKALMSSTSLQKVSTALGLAHDGKLFDNFHYHSAVTKRWSGKGVQIHNFPRSNYVEGDLDPEDPEFVDKARLLGEEGLIGLDWVKNNLRRIWTAPSGYRIICSDYSKIEPVVLFWLSGQGRVPGNWYEQVAGTIYGVSPFDIKKDSFERHLGKTAALSCGYGVGPDKFRDSAFRAGLDISQELAKKAIMGHGQIHPKILSFRQRLMEVFSEVYHTGVHDTLSDGLLRIEKHKGVGNRSDIHIILPSGGRLFYRGVMYESGDNGSEMTHLTAKYGRVKLWSGLLTENVVSATAREILASAVLRLEEHGFNVICSVHDEIWALEKYDESSFDDRLESFKWIMEAVPGWARGLTECKSEMVWGRRYRK